MAISEEHDPLVSDSDESTLADSVDSEKALSRPRNSRGRIGRSVQKSNRQTRLTWLRWSLIISLQSIIIAMLFFQRNGHSVFSPGDVPAGGDINGLYREVPRQYKGLKFEEELYMPNMTSNDNREEVKQRWDMLMPRGGGSLGIPDWKNHPLLGLPITDDPIRSRDVQGEPTPLYEASWTHALHCLYYSVDTYHQLVLNGPTGNESHDHASHCFEYLRQNILCSLDMTLEGSYSAHDESGGQMHVCRDRAQAVKWIEQRRLDDLQDIVGS